MFRLWGSDVSLGQLISVRSGPKIHYDLSKIFTNYQHHYKVQVWYSIPSLNLTSETSNNRRILRMAGWDEHVIHT